MLSWHQLPTVRAPTRYGIQRAGIAGAQQSLALDGLRGQDHRHALVVQLETLGRLLHAVPEPHALVAVDHDAQAMDHALSHRAHIPSSPSSPRAVSITAGGVSAMLRRLAESAEIRVTIPRTNPGSGASRASASTG